MIQLKRRKSNGDAEGTPTTSFGGAAGADAGPEMCAVRWYSGDDLGVDPVKSTAATCKNAVAPRRVLARCFSTPCAWGEGRAESPVERGRMMRRRRKKREREERAKRETV